MDAKEYISYLNEIRTKIKSLTDKLWDIQENRDFLKQNINLKNK